MIAHLQMSAGPDPREHGSVLTTLLMIMIPMLMLIGAVTTLMTGRNTKLLRTIQENKALLAASAAIEAAAQDAQDGILFDDASGSVDLGGGLTATYFVRQLATDNTDNDGDGLVDEADERAFEVVAEGRLGRVHRRLSGLLIEPAPPPTMHAAIHALGTPEIRTNGRAIVNGEDTRISGAPASPPNAVHGIAAESPHSGIDLLDRYTESGTSAVLGEGGAPSFGTSPTILNLPGLAAVVRVEAANVLTPGTFAGGLGDATANDWQVSYCPGDLHLTSSVGAGILLVSGDLYVSGNSRFDGLVIVMGSLTMSGTPLINGGLVQGPEADEIRLTGSSTVRYSSDALNHLTGLLTQVYVVEGWREIAR